MKNDLDFLSTLMRNRALDEDELQTIDAFLRPLTREESDISEAFVVSEARIAVLSDPEPMISGSSWLARLFIQRNATLNEEYVTVFAPMARISALDSKEYYARKAYEDLPYDIPLFPPPLYNLGGRLARESSVWSDGVQLYPARVHDQDGRISLVLLQAEIAEDRDSPIQEVIRKSRHRNPYTGEPMSYDEEAGTIGFECMHTIFHPPAPPDVCSFPIGRSRR